MAKPSVDISISIANFNTRELLKNCLRSIATNTNGLKVEIIVVDNGSKGGSVAMIKNEFRKVILMRNSKNLFFSRAYNQALKKAQGKYFLILNSDTQITKGSLQELSKFMQGHPEAASVSTRLVDQHGKLDRTCSRFPTPQVELLESNLIGRIFKNQKLVKNYRYANWQRNTYKKVDVIPGSFMFTRRNVVEKLGGFDNNLLLFYSDCDLCLRIKKAGYTNYFNPDVTIIHLQSQTVKKLKEWQLAKISLSDMLYYYRKHFGFVWWLFLWLTYRPNWLYWRLKSIR